MTNNTSCRARMDSPMLTGSPRMAKSLGMPIAGSGWLKSKASSSCKTSDANAATSEAKWTLKYLDSK